MVITEEGTGVPDDFETFCRHQNESLKKHRAQRIACQINDTKTIRARWTHNVQYMNELESLRRQLPLQRTTWTVIHRKEHRNTIQIASSASIGRSPVVSSVMHAFITSKKIVIYADKDKNLHPWKGNPIWYGRKWTVRCTNVLHKFVIL